MKTSEQISALIDAYIELGQDHGYNDSQIIDALLDIFDKEELEAYGFPNFIKDYFSEDPAQYDVDEVFEARIVDNYDVDNSSKLFTVEISPSYFVDVKVCTEGELNGLVYIMQNEDGSAVYQNGNPDVPCPAFVYDETAVISLVKEASAGVKNEMASATLNNTEKIIALMRDQEYLDGIKADGADVINAVRLALEELNKLDALIATANQLHIGLEWLCDELGGHNFEKGSHFDLNCMSLLITVVQNEDDTIALDKRDVYVYPKNISDEPADEMFILNFEEGIDFDEIEQFAGKTVDGLISDGKSRMGNIQPVAKENDFVL